MRSGARKKRIVADATTRNFYWQRYEAGLHEQRAHERGRAAEEHYWHEYGAGVR